MRLSTAKIMKTRYMKIEELVEGWIAQVDFEDFICSNRERMHIQYEDLSDEALDYIYELVEDDG